MEHIDTGNYFEEKKKHSVWMKSNATKCKTARSLFCGHVRTYENFARLNSDPDVVKPPGSPLEVEGLYSSHILQYYLLMSCRKLRDKLATSLGIGLLCGTVGTYLWILETYQDHQDRTWGEEPSGQVYNGLILPLAQAFRNPASDYKFFPTFAVLGLLGFFINRWRNFFFAAWRVEGRLKDMAIMLGAAVADPQSNDAKEELFRCYRFMCAAMGMQYKSLIKPLKGDDPVGTLVELGLLTEEEADILRPSGSRVRDNLLTWIGVEAMNGLRNGVFDNLSKDAFMHKLSDCRANMMFFHGNNFFPVSQVWTSMVQTSIDLWIILLALGAPFKLYVRPSEQLNMWAAAQPWISVGTTPLCFAYMGTMAVCQLLQRPFGSSLDTLNIDALVAGTEETLFANLRASFNMDAAKNSTNQETDSLDTCTY